MRHKVKSKKLNKTASHLKSMIRNLTSCLILNEELKTTKQKAKLISANLDRIISVAKKKVLAWDNMNAIRYISPKLAKISWTLENKDEMIFDVSSKKVVDDLVNRYSDRVSWFSRTIKIWTRSWDSSDIVLMKLV